MPLCTVQTTKDMAEPWENQLEARQRSPGPVYRDSPAPRGSRQPSPSWGSRNADHILCRSGLSRLMQETVIRCFLSGAASFGPVAWSVFRGPRRELLCVAMSLIYCAFPVFC
jgi:hypothetical protein